MMMLMQAKASTVDAAAPFTPVNNRLDELAEEWVCDDCSEHCARNRCHMCGKTDSDDDFHDRRYKHHDDYYDHDEPTDYYDGTAIYW